MPRNKPAPAPDAASSEQRRLARKRVLLDGVLAGLGGENAAICVIHDIHTQGAAVSSAKNFALGTQVFLLDTANSAAHEAKVVWSKADRCGLLFAKSYAMHMGLPPRLAFLWRLLFAAKLSQAERALARGISPALAFSTIGLTREFLQQMNRHAAADPAFLRLLLRARRLQSGRSPHTKVRPT
jgi:hypothetical protein